VVWRDIEGDYNKMLLPVDHIIRLWIKFKYILHFTWVNQNLFTKGMQITVKAIILFPE